MADTRRPMEHAALRGYTWLTRGRRPFCLTSALTDATLYSMTKSHRQQSKHGDSCRRHNTSAVHMNRTLCWKELRKCSWQHGSASAGRRSQSSHQFVPTAHRFYWVVTWCMFSGVSVPAGHVTKLIYIVKPSRTHANRDHVTCSRNVLYLLVTVTLNSHDAPTNHAVCRRLASL